MLVDLKTDIYSDANKVKIIEEVLLEHIASMDKQSTLTSESEE